MAWRGIMNNPYMTMYLLFQTGYLVREVMIIQKWKRQWKKNIMAIGLVSYRVNQSMKEGKLKNIGYGGNESLPSSITINDDEVVVYVLCGGSACYWSQYGEEVKEKFESILCLKEEVCPPNIARKIAYRT